MQHVEEEKELQTPPCSPPLCLETELANHIIQDRENTRSNNEKNIIPLHECERQHQVFHKFMIVRG